MNIRLNGHTRSVPTPQTVDTLLREVRMDVGGVAVAVDGQVVPRSLWPTTRLAEGVTVEVVTATQGG